MAKKKSRLPKTLFGVKVPKVLRKSNILRSLLDSPMGRDMMANALTAAAGAAAAVLLGHREEVADAGAKGARKGAKAVGLAAETVQSAASAAMNVVTDTARSILPAAREDQGPRTGKRTH